jgi:hypothetical protein
MTNMRKKFATFHGILGMDILDRFNFPRLLLSSWGCAKGIAQVHTNKHQKSFILLKHKAWKA